MSTHPVVGPAEHPALQLHMQMRQESVQNRIADKITQFAGSMIFVYMHIGLFIAWMLVVENKPWPTLTLVVSLEAIFLSTFVMISQNRADEKRQILADNQWKIVQVEEEQNEQLIGLSKQILDLTQAIHQMTSSLTPKG